MLEFGINFTIGVWGAAMWHYYEKIWETILGWSADYVNALDIKWKNYHRVTVSTYRLTGAETVLAFIIVLPIIITQLILIKDKYMNLSSL